MAIFSTRSGSQRSQEAARKSNVPVDSVETLRTRARQRLIGAFVLVVLGVIGFTLMFDTQPRPIPVDIDIIIPDKDKADRLAIPSTPAAPPAVISTAPAASAPVATVPPVAAVAAGAAAASVAAVAANNVQNSASLSAKEEIVASKPSVKAEAKVEKKPEVAVAAKAEPKAAIKPEVKTEAKPVAKPAVVDDGAKAKAILEGKDPVKESAKEPAKAASATAAADAAGRFVVQVGAFADGVKAHEVRVKVERAGLKTYTHVAQTKDGARTRVRVGPFASRAEAEKAAAKIKNLDLPAAILTL
jgi:DedD protein